MKSNRCIFWCLLSARIWCAAAFANQVGEATKPPLSLQGKLISLLGTGPALRTPKKDYRLAGKTQYLFHTLQDKRLLDREVRLEGTERADGSFEVERVYTVRNGKLYRVRYYCEVCNIEALEPGDCVCCQQPTELQEIPVRDAGGETIITP